MSNNLEIVKRLYDACIGKDFATVKTLLHPQYTLKDPMMQISGPDQMIEMMQNCPFENRMENVTFIDGGDTIVTTFDCVSTKPVQSTMHMCNIVKLEGGKVKAEEMFYDTAQMPQQVRDEMQKSMSSGKKAA